MLRRLALTIGAFGVLGIASAAGSGKEVLIPKFIEESSAAGTAVFDCDGDGLPEVFIARGLNTSKLFKNKSTRIGKIDLVILRVGQVDVYRGTGGYKFERVTDKWNLHKGNGWYTELSATWDNGQSWSTLAIGTYIDRDQRTFPCGNCTPTLIFRPKGADGGGYQAPIELKPGYCGLSMLFYDWSGKGQTLLRVSNDREFHKAGKEQMWSLEGGGVPRELGEADG